MKIIVQHHNIALYFAFCRAIPRRAAWLDELTRDAVAADLEVSNAHSRAALFQEFAGTGRVGTGGDARNHTDSGVGGKAAGAPPASNVGGNSGSRRTRMR